MLRGPWPVITEGVAERGSVYAISTWEIMTGLVLLAWARRMPNS
jgi:hypothetical protein